MMCALFQAGPAAAQGTQAGPIAPGRVEAASVMAVGAAATGVIAEVAVQEGERIHAGQLLVP
jgi:multidrug efflux pump subunit AcrA (membrane-fusion protein)